MKKNYDLIVIGAGASGLTAAFIAAKAGKAVLVVDSSSSPAVKVAVSGGGKCNFSNRNVHASHYLSNNPHFCKSALARLHPQDITKILDNAEIKWEEREKGKLFAFSGIEIRDFLVKRAVDNNVEIQMRAEVKSVQKNQNGFELLINQDVISAANVLIATGGMSYPSVGATDFGMRLAKQFTLKTVKSRPALVSLSFCKNDGMDWSGLSGLSLPARISIGKKSFEEDLLFTHQGFSGLGIFQASLYWEEGMPVQIDFMPDVNAFELLKSRRQVKDKKQIATALSEKMPQRLAQRFAGTIPVEKRNLPLTELSDKIFTTLAANLNAYSFIPSATGGWDKAEVTKGGVDTTELFSTTMACRKVPNLYFAGEVMDVTGELGGFNLHWAWASGTVAGYTVASSI